MAKWNDLFVVSAVPIMPKLSVPDSNLLMKTALTITEPSTQPAFYSNMAAENGARIGAQATLVNTTDRQTIFEIVSGVSGALTHVVGLSTQVANTASVFVTADGVEVEYKFYNIIAGSRVVLGGIKQVQVPTTDQNADILGFRDAGWIAPGGVQAGLITAEQAISEGIGHPFDDNIKVEIQYGTLPAGSVQERSAGVTYVRD